MAEQDFRNEEGTLANIKLAFSVNSEVLDQVTPQEIILGESLLTPGLQTSVRVHSYIHNLPVKNLDDYKNSTMSIDIERPVLERYKINPLMQVRQRVYRLDSRQLINNNTEEFVIHACDPTLLNDAKSLVSKLWKCTTPSAVVSDVLRSCVGARNLDIESSSPARDYVAENIHPFQVVAQNANAALADGDDPSFVHYMTFKNFGTHHFRSLNSLTQKPPVMDYHYSEIGYRAGYGDPNSIMTYSFPCDFDLLSDILNGVDENGKEINSMAIFNPLMKMFNLFGNKALGCGIGGGSWKAALSNAGSAQNQNACPDYAQAYILKRQARMGLLEQDKIALRLTVPWNTKLHAGEVIRVNLYNKKMPELRNYGSGNYLIVSMTHNIKAGGFSTTTMDCVAKTVGQGIV